MTSSSGWQALLWLCPRVEFIMDFCLCPRICNTSDISLAVGAQAHKLWLQRPEEAKW